jgi:hypothetical protein
MRKRARLFWGFGKYGRMGGFFHDTPRAVQQFVCMCGKRQGLVFFAASLCQRKKHWHFMMSSRIMRMPYF